MQRCKCVVPEASVRALFSPPIYKECLAGLLPEHQRYLAT